METEAGTAGAPREDGRTARSRRTRAAVVDALLALQEEGNLAPTAQQVAARAGVALRTVFGHFSDMETLWVEAGQRELQVLVDLADEVDPALPLAERIARFAASRSVVLERLLPVSRAARLREPTSPALRANRAMFIAVGDEEVRTVFATELAARAPEEARRLLAALYVVAGVPGWEALRLDRGCSVDQARDDVARHLTALLDPAAAPEDRL
ncbi:MAG TPA: TetR/AcrR family transcriptional regulator [Mycobacteriales bacterium]|nr:TetR/AcrR family transcriptional regulator [Mycobacteriales bacterium]